MAVRQLPLIDEENIRQWHDEVLIGRYHVRMSMSAANRIINWYSLAFGFFLGKGYKISKTRALVQELVVRRILEPLDGT